MRLAHPFPSVLNALATLAIATLAGAQPLAAGRLALSMLLIQASIGALNDLVDAGRDASAKPGKPIPSGLATRAEAGWLAAVAGVLGILLSLPSGVPTAAVIGLGLLLGYLYDLRLSRTPWSWLPLALALPIVPIHAWLGATGGLPAELGPLYPAAVVAGAALALANGLVDVERDALSRRPTLAVTLGAGRAWALHALLLGILAGLVVLLSPALRVGAGPVEDALSGRLPMWAATIGLAALALGAAALRARDAGIRERGWELEAVGVGAVGIGWLAGIATGVSGGA